MGFFMIRALFPLFSALALTLLTACELFQPAPAPMPEPLISGQEQAVDPESGGEGEFRPASLPSSTVIYFEHDSARLDAESERLLESLAADVKESHTKDGRAVSVEMHGHTDRTGPDRYNSLLSMRRAQTVLEAFAARGVPRGQLRALGYGESDPAIPTPDGVAEPKNRRVELYIGG